MWKLAIRLPAFHIYETIWQSYYSKSQMYVQFIYPRKEVQDIDKLIKYNKYYGMVSQPYSWNNFIKFLNKFRKSITILEINNIKRKESG